MIKKVEELSVEPQSQLLSDGEGFGDIRVPLLLELSSDTRVARQRAKQHAPVDAGAVWTYSVSLVSGSAQRVQIGPII